MKKITISYIAIGCIIIFSSCSRSKFVHESVSDRMSCDELNGTWYNGQCWDFEDIGYETMDIEAYVDDAKLQIARSKVTYDGTDYPIHNAVIDFPEDQKQVLLIITFQVETSFLTMLFYADSKLFNEVFESENIAFIPAEGFLLPYNILDDSMGDATEEQAPIAETQAMVLQDGRNLKIDIDGRWLFDDDGQTKAFSTSFNETVIGMGDSVLEIEGDAAYLSGILGVVAYMQIEDLIQNHPQIKTLVLTKSRGSVDDLINMHTGRMLRRNGFTTKVLSNSHIASGAVDLFSSGVRRIVEKGAKIGVHSWCCMKNLTAAKIPKEHPAHKHQLEYFTTMLGESVGTEFYYYTLESAPYNGMYYMTDEEIQEWTLSTEFIK
ncbi:MAG: hypothetical protein B6D68_01845 [spirochete symbiont of Stewartia floridana]|nr:MAG: hypothetical protein B6D68_01845 [spirochete symbiont of Stewartia floridana]